MSKIADGVGAGVFWTTWLLCKVLVGWTFPVRSRGEDAFPRQGPLLIVSNHQSLLDPIVLGMTMPRRAGYLARKSLFRPRPFGWYLRAVGAVPIDRDGVATEGLKTTIQLLRMGRPMVIFPEGTRTLDGRLQSIKPGIALLLNKTDAPVVLAGIAGSYECWPRSAKRPRRGPIEVTYARWQPPLSRDRETVLMSLEAALRAAVEESESRLPRVGARRGEFKKIPDRVDGSGDSS